ncbi:MAG: hypothetical protein ACE366_09335 [Bradymonadia bacterium]
MKPQLLYIVRFLILCLLSTAGLMVAPESAHGQRSAYQAMAEMERLLNDARAYYEDLELDEADAALDRALRLAERFDIKEPIVADVHILRGILLFVRDRRRNEGAALDAFVSAITIDDRARIDPLISTPSLEDLLEQARREARRRPPPRDNRREPRNDRPPPRRQPDLVHEPVRDARGGQEIRLNLEVSQEIDERLYRVYVYFRSARADSVQRVEMVPEGARRFTTRIPGRFVAGRSLQYYIVVEDRRRQPIAGVRSAQEPFVIKLQDEVFGDIDRLPEGDSLIGDGDGNGDGDGDGDWDGGWEDEEGEQGSGERFMSLTLNVGTGFGFITDFATPVQRPNTDVVAGLAPAPFHTMLELDFWLTESFAIGAFARVQIVEFEHLEGVRLKFQVVNAGDHHLQLRLGGGYGEVRHLVDLGNFLDTTKEGPFSWTAGLLYSVDFGKDFAFVVGPDFYHLFGDSPSYHVDINLGIQTSF